MLGESGLSEGSVGTVVVEWGTSFLSFMDFYLLLISPLVISSGPERGLILTVSSPPEECQLTPQLKNTHICDSVCGEMVKGTNSGAGCGAERAGEGKRPPVAQRGWHQSSGDPVEEEPLSRGRAVPGAPRAFIRAVPGGTS